MLSYAMLCCALLGYVMLCYARHNIAPAKSFGGRQGFFSLLAKTFLHMLGFSFTIFSSKEILRTSCENPEKKI